MLDVEFSQLSDPGRIRPRNEDYLGSVVPPSPERARSHGWLFALADGVGGQRQGEVASRAAVTEIVAGFSRAAPMDPHRDLIPRLVRSANERVCEAEALAGPAGAGMASTIVVCGLRFDRATIAHAGDSRCYLIRSGHVRQVTQDHTVAGEQVRLGILSTKEAGNVPTRHVLSRSLGSGLFVNVDLNEVALAPGDMLLLCSDGLHGAVTSAEMVKLLAKSPNLDVVARDLVDLANEQDGGDNVSVQLIRVRNIERMGMYRGRSYKVR